MPNRTDPSPASPSPGNELPEVEARYREKIRLEAAKEDGIQIPEALVPTATTATTTSVTAKGIVPPAAPAEPINQSTLEMLQNHRRQLDAVQSQLLEALTRLDSLDERVGRIVLVLPEIRHAISRKKLAEIERDAPSTELVVLNEPHWEHHGTKFVHGRIMQPSHYAKKLSGWMDRGLRLGLNE